MELEKMTELEYKKYKEMDKVAYRPRMKENIIYLALGAIFFIAFAYIGVSIITFKPTMSVLKYTNTTVQNANLNFTTNASIAASIIKLSQNPPLQVTYFLHNYALITAIVNLILGVILIFFGYFVFRYFVDTFPAKYSASTYKSLRRTIREKDAMLKRLAEHGYTQKEIDWYFEVHSKIQELEKEVN
ncbi:MAG: hypothetical protein QXS81_05060 [Candidatus Micrarchaeaceae archaeon]